MRNNKDVLVNEEKDIRDLQLIMRIRNNIMNYIDLENTVDIIRDTINKSENFKFRSEAAEKHIDVKKPTFVIKLDDEDLHAKNKQSFQGSNDDYEIYLREYEEDVADKLDKEVLKYIGPAIFDSIKEDTELDELMKNNKIEMKDLMITNIYVYKLSDPYTNAINLSLFV
ncbi:hypothetical protein PALS2_132 [Staphylococcus phage PALS_2]|nr:hypothetical protein PALS2_132 [Staphylococcus phage PALS_2]